MKVQDIKIACLQFSDLAVDPNPIQCSNVVAENSVQCFFSLGLSVFRKTVREILMVGDRSYIPNKNNPLQNFGP